jgi:hypothetical protein
VGGPGWDEAAFVISVVSPFLVGMCIVYIVFVFTGFFLQSALDDAAIDQDHMTEQPLKENISYMANLTLLYHDLETSRVGAITFTDFFEEQMGGVKCARNTQTACIRSPSIYPRFVGILTATASTRASCLISKPTRDTALWIHGFGEAGRCAGFPCAGVVGLRLGLIGFSRREMLAHDFLSFRIRIRPRSTVVGAVLATGLLISQIHSRDLHSAL